MDTIEGNKLTAEFMGEQRMIGCYYIPSHGEWTLIPYSYESEVKEHYTPEEMKYHSSWDWLMPVVEKIESMLYKVHINTGNCEIYSCELFEKDNLIINKYYGDFKNEITTKITAVWLACVDFIKWYNENK